VVEQARCQTHAIDPVAGPVTMRGTMLANVSAGLNRQSLAIGCRSSGFVENRQ